jgi:LPXTG-motif cell wall-anchored protein
MSKLSIVLLLVGVVLYFTGKQNTVSIVLMALGGLGLLAGIYISNRREG